MQEDEDHEEFRGHRARSAKKVIRGIITMNGSNTQMMLEAAVMIKAKAPNGSQNWALALCSYQLMLHI
ncbi:hypothetical protein GBA52_022666 [Prunus armeniaca]|nr:hypothetical protein GBA52_022666 [Prunus armeniaca]